MKSKTKKPTGKKRIYEKPIRTYKPRPTILKTNKRQGQPMRI